MTASRRGSGSPTHDAPVDLRDASLTGSEFCREALDVSATHGQRRRKLKNMPFLSIPDEALPDLEKITEVDQAFFDSILTAIKETGPSLTGGQLENKIVGKLKPPDNNDLSAILR